MPRKLDRGVRSVADGSDNFATRFLVNDACYFAGKTLVTAAIAQFDGQLATFKAYREGDHPCYRCVFREAPHDFDEGCARDGVLGALAGVMGSLQAVEVLKELLESANSLLAARSPSTTAWAGGFTAWPCAVTPSAPCAVPILRSAICRSTAVERRKQRPQRQHDAFVPAAVRPHRLERRVIRPLAVWRPGVLAQHRLDPLGNFPISAAVRSTA